MVPTNQKDVNSDSNLSHKNLDLNPPGFNPANWIPSQQWSGVRTWGGGRGIMHGRPTILMVAGQNGIRFMGIWSQ